MANYQERGLQREAPEEIERKLRTPFVEKLEARQKSVNSLLCVGLDPVIENIPGSFKDSVLQLSFSENLQDGTVLENVLLLADQKPRESEMLLHSRILEEFDKKIIDETHEFVSAYKLNIAFYERYGEYGLAALSKVIKYIRKVDSTIPVILDAKRADIGATNEGYAEMVLSMGVDAVTVNPYFGTEGDGALNPFLELEDIGIIVLCRTSNKEASRMQDQMIDDGKLGRVPYFIMVADMAEEARLSHPNVAIVVGATVPDQLREARKIFNGPILVPGLGKQGGKPQDLINAFDENELGIIANNSSAIIHASKGDDFAQAARNAAREWRDSINEIRVPNPLEVVNNMTSTQLEVAEMMLRSETDGKLTRRYGEPGSYTYEVGNGRFPMITIAKDEHEFVGAAHLKEPQNPDIPLLDYFANLRGGTPENYDLMASVLSEITIPFEFDYVTGIPNTGNSIAEALARKLNVPYFQILEKPKEGLERQFSVRDFRTDETRPEPGMKGLLVDDLITGAVTKIVAEEALTKEGFEIAGHAVVFDREEGGVEEMEAMGKVIVSGVTATQVFALASLKDEANHGTYKRIIKKNIQRRLAKTSSK